MSCFAREQPSFICRSVVQLTVKLLSAQPFEYSIGYQGCPTTSYRFRSLYLTTKTATSAGCPDFPPEKGLLGCCPFQCHEAGPEKPLHAFDVDATSLSHVRGAGKNLDATRQLPPVQRRIYPAFLHKGGEGLHVGRSLFQQAFRGQNSAFQSELQHGSTEFVKEIESLTKKGTCVKDDCPCNRFDATAAAGGAKKSSFLDEQKLFGATCRRVTKCMAPSPAPTTSKRTCVHLGMALSSAALSWSTASALRIPS